MPHYKNGDLVILGDFAKGPDASTDAEVAGQVVQIQASTDTCNLTLAGVDVAVPSRVVDGKLVPIEYYYPILSVRTRTVTASKCQKIG